MPPKKLIKRLAGNSARRGQGSQHGRGLAPKVVIARRIVDLDPIEPKSIPPVENLSMVVVSQQQYLHPYMFHLYPNLLKLLEKNVIFYHCH